MPPRFLPPLVHLCPDSHAVRWVESSGDELYQHSSSLSCAVGQSFFEAPSTSRYVRTPVYGPCTQWKGRWKAAAPCRGLGIWRVSGSATTEFLRSHLCSFIIRDQLFVHHQVPRPHKDPCHILGQRFVADHFNQFFEFRSSSYVR